MKYVRNIIVIVLALILQSTIIGRYTIIGIRPDLAMLALLVLVNWSGPVEIILYGFCLGFIQDVYSPENLGMNAFTMSVLAYVLYKVKEKLTFEQVPVKVMTAFAACLVHDLLYFSIHAGFEGQTLLKMFLLETIPGAIYTSLLFVGFIIIWEWIRRGGLIYVLEGLFRE